ncbi:helix-turn-helix transcriptional regulator [Fodinicola acaciae]|uniref:helix-turn-helix transcriptional regulator n=1 Tax=Fodinicola acaciae TaxID=2681555 RepID=UPI0013D26D19|nr:WYL domain-containing protein [Fodinicola acaciae]
MNRTERLYALVEELRATAPRQRTVPWLAERFDVSVRTIQRDLQALMATGVPVRAVPGPAGGWFIDPTMTLPPVNLTVSEAIALTAAAAAAERDAPFGSAARTAVQKLTAAMSPAIAAEAKSVAIHTIPRADRRNILEAVENAVTRRVVIRIGYVDAGGGSSVREVEPAGLLTSRQHWYLIGWCRKRRAGRGFRLDRVESAELTGEPSPEHDAAVMLAESTVVTRLGGASAI